MMKNDFLYVGSWLAKDGRSGGGLRLYRVGEDGSLELIEQYVDDVAAGYIAFSADKRTLYTVNEIKRKPDCVQTDGRIYAFRIDPKSGRLSERNQISSCGVFPNYLAVSPDGSCLAAVNYGSEDVTVRSCRTESGEYRLENVYEESSLIAVDLEKDGSLGKIRDLHRFSGEPSRYFEWFQASPHPHCVGLDPSGQMLLVADRGCDEVVTIPFDAKKASFGSVRSFRTERGIGPRNCAFHQRLPFVYVVGEVKPYVMAFRYDADRAEIELTGEWLCADEKQVYNRSNVFLDCAHPSDIRIHPDGTMLYVLSRGNDQIVCFRIDAEDGSLELTAKVPAEGSFPWSAGITEDGRFLFVGNKGSGCISSFAIGADGIPVYGGYSTPAENCVSVRALRLEM